MRNRRCFNTAAPYEESLKCVENYLVKTEKEGQREQALKVHAEQKLRVANEETSQLGARPERRPWIPGEPEERAGAPPLSGEDRLED